MTAYRAATIVNVALIALTAFVFHRTNSIWSFLLLAFMFQARSEHDD